MFGLTVSVASAVQCRVQQLRRDASQVQGRIDTQPRGSARRLRLFCPIVDGGRQERAALGEQQLLPLAVAVAEPHPGAELSQPAATRQADVK